MHTQTTIEQLQKQVADLTRERDAYKASSEEYCAVLDASMDAVIFTAAGGRIFHANRAACDLFQMTETELFADGRAYLNADNDEALARVLQELRETRRFQGVINHRKKDGTVFPGEVSSVLFASANGEERSCTIIRDRSAEMQVSREREEAVQKYTTLLESFPLGVTISDEDGDIIETNAAAEQLLGLGREEHETRSLSGRQWQIIRPDGTPMPSEEWASVIALKERRRVENCVLGVIRPDAKVIWLNVMATPLPIAGFGVIVTYSDVTEKKCGEEYLEKYKNIVSSTQDGIAFLDDEYRYRIVNDAYERFSGVKKETFIGLSIAEYLGEDVFQEVIQPQFDKCMQGETIHYQQWFDYPSLGRRFVDVTYVPYKDANNRITGVVATTRDNTAQRLVEETLQNSEEQFRTLATLAPVGIYLTSPRGYCQYVNPVWCAMAGMHPEAASGDGWMNGLHPDDRPRVFDAWRKMVAEDRHWGLEYRFRTPGGKVTWVYGTASPQRDANGAILAYVGVNVDITERKMAEQALRESEAKFRSLAEISRDYIIRYDQHGHHTYMNPAALTIAGLKESDILGKTNREVGFPEHLCTMWDEQIDSVFASGKSCQVEFSWESASGPVYLDWRLTPELDGEGKVISVLGVSRDITERKQLEKVQTFLADTSSRTTVEPFFYSLARFLAENLTMDFVCIDRLEGDGLTARTVAVWHDGQFEDNVSYALKDTPCGELVGQTICCYAASVTQLFPKDQVLLNLQAESYAGVTLFSHSGQPIGLIALISRQPLKDRRLVENTLRMVAVRAAGEMERLDAEIALKTSEQLLSDIAVNIPGAIYQFVRYPDGSHAIPYMSESGSTVLDQPLEVLHDASSLFTNVHPDDRPGLYSSISESAVTMREWRQEFRILLKNGDLRWLLGISQPSHSEDGGICWNGVLLDITKNKKVEEELARTTEQLELTGEMAKIGGWELDLKSNKMIFSRTARLINEVDPNVELSLSDAFAMIDTDDRVAHQVEVESSLISGVPWDRELRMTTAKGRPIWVRVQGVPVMENGRVVKLHGTFQDITEKNQAEEEKKKLQDQLHHAQKMEAIGTLAGGIAHDFNNILGAIVGYSEMIREDLPPDSPSIHDINQVLTASHRAKDLVKQILAFSRQVEDQKIPMQPAGIVKEAITLLRSSLPTTITIQQNIDPDAGMVLGDPTQVHQIVMNLATNAFHAMEVKGGTLTICLQKRFLSQDDLFTLPDLQPGAFVQLSVRDTGEGILPEIRERIFDPFFTTKEVGKGTGLGLSMVYSIVKSCNGAIVCESRPGQGTEFRILLPTLEGQAVQASEATDVTPHGKEHILFIDDEEMLVELGQAMLKRLGYHVTTRTNSLDALMTFQNQPDQFDLIITDQTMPGMTGVDFARRILQIRPQMPIILCTGYSSQISEDKAKAAGIKGFAFKPLAKKEIGELIRKVLDEKNL